MPHTAYMEAHTLTSSNLEEIWREIEKERYIYIYIYIERELFEGGRLVFLRRFDGLTGSPGKSQEEKT